MVEPEIPLDGGADSTVVRVGQTVRRDGRSWSPAVLDLLQHIEREGFAGAPRALGFVDHGQEVLAMLRNSVISLLRRDGHRDIAAQLRRYSGNHMSFWRSSASRSR